MNLSEKQRLSINHVYGPALVLAVPGAGKTTVLVHRIHSLISKHKVDPSRILSITFSRASARDMRSRFDQLFPNFSKYPVEFSTIHAFCFRLIGEYSSISKVNYKLIEGNKGRSNKYHMLKEIYFSVNNSHITEDRLENLVSSISYIKNIMIDVDTYIKRKKPDIANLKEIYLRYENNKRQNNLFDFDDMLSISLEILQNNQHLLGKYRNKYDFIQVDEGQDTSKLQMEIIKLLAKPKNNLLIVADDDQSIYGFRGAYPKSLLNFNKIYKDGKIFFMEENYRSSKNIVSICNKFIQHNTLRYDKNIYTNNSYIEPINIVKVKSVNDQYRYIMEDLEGHNMSNSCILYRNNISSIGVIDYLENNNVPFSIRDRNLKFFNHWLLRDIINILYLAEDISRMDLYEGLYYKIKGYISKKQINFAKTLDSKISVFDRIMKYPGLNRHYKRRLRELKLDFKKISNLSPKDGISYIKYNLEYDEYLRESSIRFGYTYNNLNTILFYLKMIAEKCSNLNDFINRLRHLQYLSANSNENSNSITLSTIHAAKGLEFERVYIIDLINGDFPNSSSIESFKKGDIESFEEERRVFYVGLSRAKNHLSLLNPHQVSNQRVDPSEFLIELQNTYQYND
ncbi:MAG TPA: ATP-dependent helicase [Tissierellaceae bacterium]|nr:ATP-dependent helicase [Tissierellaceae bacterium]